MFEYAVTYLVYVEPFEHGIEAGIEVVQEIDDLHGCTLSRDIREPDHVAEIYGHVIEELPWELVALFELFSHDPGGIS